MIGSASVKVSATVQAMVARLESKGMTDNAWLRARFISTDLIDKAWTLNDKIDAEYMTQGEKLNDSVTWKRFVFETVAPCYRAWLEVLKSVNAYKE